MIMIIIMYTYTIVYYSTSIISIRICIWCILCYHYPSELDKRCCTRMATSDLSLPTSAPPSSLAQSWQYWRWSCWAHYSPNRPRCSATGSNDPTQSNPIPRILSSQTPMWLNVTPSSKGRSRRFTQCFPTSTCTPVCIASRAACQRWPWLCACEHEKSGNEYPKHYRSCCNRCTNIFHFNISISFSRSQHVTACSNGASELCTLSTEFLSGELGRSLELTASVSRRSASRQWPGIAA